MGGPGGPGAEAGGAVAPAGATAKQGIYAKHAGDYDKALAIFEANLSSNPNDQLALWGKAWIQAERGQKIEAVETFNKFLALSKDKPKIKEGKAALSRLK
jgi:tetratricopeptide (TPR) repeat protein